MKNFWKILGFEYLGCIRNKAFIIVTILLLVLSLVTTSIPAIISALKSAETGEDDPDAEKPVIFIGGNDIYSEDEIRGELAKYYPGYELKIGKEDEDAVKKNVNKGKYSFAVIYTSPLSYTYVTKNNSLYSADKELVSGATKSIYVQRFMKDNGVDAKKAAEITNAAVAYTEITTGTDSSKSFIPVYLLMCILFVAIVSYGQLVAQSVVSEKNTRAMELLITCARPTELMFGKVIGSGLAGLTQLTLILSVTFTSFNTVTTKHLDQNVLDFLNFPLSTVLYALLFFILGYFMFSFLVGALASFAGKSEDLSNLTAPVNFIMMAVYMIMIFMSGSDSFNSPFMTALSYIPLSSPMAMFMRINLSDVAVWEICLSVALQMATVWLTGLLAAAIYKVGVLMYGKPPKLSEIFKLTFTKK